MSPRLSTQRRAADGRHRGDPLLRLLLRLPRAAARAWPLILGAVLTSAMAQPVALALPMQPEQAAHTGQTAPPERVAPTPRAQPPDAGSESLPALLARVLPHEPQVRVAQALLQVSLERRRQARSRLGPTLSLSATRGNSQELEFGNAIDRRTDRAEAALRWNLYNYGNDAAELAGATRDIVAATEELRRAREETAERIADAYAELLRLDSLWPRSEARLEAVRRLVQQVKRQNQAGKASDADAQLAQASELDALIAHELVQSDRDSAQQRLAALVDGEVRATLPIAFATSMSADTLLLPRPGVASAALERAQSARARVRPVASLLAPRIDLEYRQQLRDQTTPQATTEQQRGWLLTARWEFPVGGELQSRRTEGQRRAEAAEAEAERVLRGVQSELVTLGPRIHNAQSAVAKLEQQIEHYNALVRAGELQFEAGRRSLSQLVQLHDSRFNAEQRRADQLRRLLGTQLRQLALSGGLLPALGQSTD